MQLTQISFAEDLCQISNSDPCSAVDLWKGPPSFSPLARTPNFRISDPTARKLISYLDSRILPGILQPTLLKLIQDLPRQQAMECIANAIQLQILQEESHSSISHQQLTNEDQAIFYSHWYNIAIWLAAVIPQYATTAKLSEHLELPVDVVIDVLNFLITRGLLKQKNNLFQSGKNVIHVPHDSAHVGRHYINWRLKALQSMEGKNNNNLFYTAPLSLSAELAEKIREQLLFFIQERTKEVVDSSSETLYCLNIDWFKF